MGEVEEFVADMTRRFRGRVQDELMASWRAGCREGLAIAERMSRGVRAEVGEGVAVAALDGLIGALQLERAKLD